MSKLFINITSLSRKLTGNIDFGVFATTDDDYDQQVPEVALQ